MNKQINGRKKALLKGLRSCPVSCVFFAGEFILLTIVICQRQWAINVLATFILLLPTPGCWSMSATPAGPVALPHPLDVSEDTQSLAWLHFRLPAHPERQG